MPKKLKGSNNLDFIFLFDNSVNQKRLKDSLKMKQKTKLTFQLVGKELPT